MAKKGLSISTLNRVLKEGEQWALCIGAGTSKFLIPDWKELINKLIEDLSLPNKEKVDDIFALGYSFDAIIQAIKDMTGMDDKVFIEYLSDIIYSPIKNQLDDKEWIAFKTVHDWTIGYASKDTTDHQERWDLFSECKERVFKNTTAYSLAKMLANGFSKGIKPSSILTFNGEACFLALLNSFLFDNNSHCIPKQFDRIINSISDRGSTKIPYYHCHGTISIKDVIYKKGYKANEKLVFSEDSYLQLANNNFSWQSSSFINTCLHNKVVFIGVSLTDSNMRRWLSWIHHTKMKEMELNKMSFDIGKSTEHYWINVRPNEKKLQKWYESLVSLLGVRIIWISKWSEAADALGIMLGII